MSSFCSGPKKPTIETLSLSELSLNRLIFSTTRFSAPHRLSLLDLDPLAILEGEDPEHYCSHCRRHHLLRRNELESRSSSLQPSLWAASSDTARTNGSVKRYNRRPVLVPRGCDRRLKHLQQRGRERHDKDSVRQGQHRRAILLSRQYTCEWGLRPRRRLRRTNHNRAVLLWRVVLRIL